MSSCLLMLRKETLGKNFGCKFAVQICEEYVGGGLSLDWWILEKEPWLNLEGDTKSQLWSLCKT
jgi:hypothetical protein